MGEDMAEDRVYAERRPADRAFVASDLGLTAVGVADDRVGRFELRDGRAARDVAAAGERVLVATGEDVLLGRDSFDGTEFGPAVAVGFDGHPIVAGPDGRVATRADGEWVSLGELDAVTAIDGSLVGGPDGVYRRAGDGLDPLGLEAVRDVSGAADLAAAADGLHRLTDGEWTRVRTGDATLVSSDGERAHAVVDGTLLDRTDGEWVDTGAPAETVVDVAYGAGVVALTADGTLCIDPVETKDGAEGWRSRSLGLAGARAVAVPDRNTV